MAETKLAERVDALEEAQEEQRVMRFLYHKADGTCSERTLSVYEVTGDAVESNLKVFGWDHGREGLRSFKIDCIHDVPQIVEDVPFREPPE